MSEENSEIWAPIPEYPGYEASTHGRIRSNARGQPRRNRWGTITIYSIRERILKQRVGQGYCYVGIRNVGARGAPVGVHCLVLRAHTGPPAPGQECRHLDGDRSNNRLGNLKWGTRKENAADRVLHGTHHRGEASPTSRLTDEQAEEIREASGSHAEVARHFGVSATTIWRIRNGQAYGTNHAEHYDSHIRSDGVVLEAIARVQSGESQLSVARWARVTPATVCAWMNGKHRADLLRLSEEGTLEELRVTATTL